VEIKTYSKKRGLGSLTLTRQTCIQIRLALADAHLANLERETRLELATLTLAR
jgi:hypothetical protein